MSFEIWLTYVIAGIVISVVPGPSVLMVMGQALMRGRRAALYCVVGDVAGGVVVMTASYAGLGVLFATSALAYGVLKWAGVAYLAYLGITQIRAASRKTTQTSIAQPAASASWRKGFLTGVLNPKGILFHMAVLAQFIDPAAAQLPQFLILLVTNTVVVASVLAGYAFAAAWVQSSLQSLRAQRRVGFAGGFSMLAGSAVLAAQR